MADSAPPCHVCGKPVAVWWPHKPEEAVCMDCCHGVEHSDGETGHQFEYSPGEGRMCRYCGSAPPADYYDGWGYD